jgi:hypothetical protein
MYAYDVFGGTFNVRTGALYAPYSVYVDMITGMMVTN